MTGGPSQVDTFDYKPELQKRDGQTLAGADPQDRLLHHQRQVPEVAVRAGSSTASPGRGSPTCCRTWPQHVDDMAFIHSCYSTAEQPRPGVDGDDPPASNRPGYPSLGAWVTYGLGSMNQNLPAFVVMHDTKPRGDDGIWSPGFLPKTYQPLLLDARRKEEIANLARDARA